MLHQQVDTHNQMMARIGEIHLGTPAPDAFPSMVPEPFETPKPDKPELHTRDGLAAICRGRGRAIEASNDRKRNRYQRAYLQWQQQKAKHDQNRNFSGY